MLLFFHVEDNGLMVEYAYSFLRLTLPNLDFITAHSSLSLHKWAVLPPYFRQTAKLQACRMIRNHSF